MKTYKTASITNKSLLNSNDYVLIKETVFKVNYVPIFDLSKVLIESLNCLHVISDTKIDFQIKDLICVFSNIDDFFVRRFFEELFLINEIYLLEYPGHDFFVYLIKISKLSNTKKSKVLNILDKML